MVPLEQVSRRVFADPSWFVKGVFGTILLLIPGAHFWAFGYVYRTAMMGRRGQAFELPDWEDWRALFVDGVRFFVIVLGLTVVPILLCWLISLPWHPVLGPLSYLPMVPALLLVAPLTAAGLYRYQRREDFREAFRLAMLLRMLVAARDGMIVPTLAFVGFLFVLFPLFPYALFTGGTVMFYYYALLFHRLEQDARAAASGGNPRRR